MTDLIPARLVRRAVREIRRAAEWWEINRPAAPGAINEATLLARDHK